MDKKVRLVNISRQTNQIQFPIWASVLNNSLRKHGIETEIIDLIPIDLEEREKQFMNALGTEPAIYGFSITAGNRHVDENERYAEMIKKRNPENVVVYGGPLSSAIPGMLLDRGNCDYVIPGEGEDSFPQLASSIIAGKIPEPKEGLFFKQNGTLVGSKRKEIRTLDNLSEPDFEGFDMDFYMNYLKEAEFSWELMASRGCKFNCSFCYKLCGTGMVYRPVDNTLDEMQWIIDNHNFKRFYFVDENLLADNTFFDTFIDRKNARHLDFTFRGMSRADAITEEKCKKGKDNGLLSMSFGIESINQASLNKTGKGTRIQQIEDTIKLLTKYDLRASMGFVFGLPWETEKDWEATYNFIKNNGIEGFFKLSYLTPLPATRIYDEAVSRGLIKDEFEYIRSLGDLYWEKAVNMTSVPDDVYTGWYNKLSGLNTKKVVYPKSPHFLKQIRKIH
ncbi:MAG: radical SAM protein [archaeon]|nr:radical SAM protein [archaeon]